MRWYSEAGVDIALSDVPVDRFMEVSEQQKIKKPARVVEEKNTPPSTTLQKQARASTAQTAPPQAIPTIPNEGAIARGAEVAGSASTLAELKDQLLTFEACNLKFTARSTVFCDGNPKANLMFIGGAPDRDEDEQGLPFVGNRGQLFDKMLAAIGLDRESSYLSCVLPWRPPGNRAPSPVETDICRPLIKRHIELVAPKTIVLVGSLPTKMLLGSKGSVMSSRGKWSTLDISGQSIPTLSMLNPAYLMQNPQHKRLAWNDLLVLKAHLEQLK